MAETRRPASPLRSGCLQFDRRPIFGTDSWGGCLGTDDPRSDQLHFEDAYSEFLHPRPRNGQGLKRFSARMEFWRGTGVLLSMMPLDAAAKLDWNIACECVQVYIVRHAARNFRDKVYGKPMLTVIA
jgi:hypothetical protein